MWRVIVTTKGPVQSVEFTHKQDCPSRETDYTDIFISEDGVKHVFYKHSIIRVDYYPIEAKD